LCSGLDIESLIKTPLIYSVSYFNLGDLILCLGPKPTIFVLLPKSHERVVDLRYFEEANCYKQISLGNC